jgi:hypothetical protein
MGIPGPLLPPALSATSGTTPSTRQRPGVLRPGARDAIGREDALHLLAELGDVQGRLDDLKRRLRELAEEG